MVAVLLLQFMKIYSERTVKLLGIGKDIASVHLAL